MVKFLAYTNTISKRIDKTGHWEWEDIKSAYVFCVKHGVDLPGSIYKHLLNQLPAITFFTIRSG